MRTERVCLLMASTQPEICEKNQVKASVEKGMVRDSRQAGGYAGTRAAMGSPHLSAMSPEGRGTCVRDAPISHAQLWGPPMDAVPDLPAIRCRGYFGREKCRDFGFSYVHTNRKKAGEILFHRLRLCLWRFWRRRSWIGIRPWQENRLDSDRIRIVALGTRIGERKNDSTTNRNSNNFTAHFLEHSTQRSGSPTGSLEN